MRYSILKIMLVNIHLTFCKSTRKLVKLTCSCLYKRYSREDSLSMERDTFLPDECPTNIVREGRHEPSTVISVPLLPVHKWFFYHELISQWCSAQILWRNNGPQNQTLQNVEKMNLFLSSPCEIFWTEWKKSHKALSGFELCKVYYVYFFQNK